MNRKIISISIMALLLASCGSATHRISYQQNLTGDDGETNLDIEVEINGKAKNKNQRKLDQKFSDGDLVTLSVTDENGIVRQFDLPNIRDSAQYYETDDLKIHYNVSDDDLVYGIGQLDDEGKLFAFNQGLLTDIQDIPKKGIVYYEGKAIGSLNKQNMNQLANGRAEIAVDFYNSHLKGELYQIDQKGNRVTGSGFGSGVNLNATIQDSYFRGEAYNRDNNDRAALKGQFNGINGESMSGSYESDRKEGMIGAFGAKVK